MEDTAKEVIERESYSLKVDETLLSSLEPGEAILCLNYDLKLSIVEKVVFSASIFLIKFSFAGFVCIKIILAC